MKIAICGKMCSGKSTLADHIMRNYSGYQIYSFSKKVKELCSELFNMNGKDRELLITFANKMRDIDENVWINQVLRETKGKHNCIIDDVRYQNEVDALIKDGWKIIQLHIPYDLQKKRIMRIYPHNYKEHLNVSNHISEQNKFVFPNSYPQLSFMIEESNESKLIHEINLLLIKY